MLVQCCDMSRPEQVLYVNKELLDWLEQQKIKNNLFTVSAPASMVALCSSIRNFKLKMKYFPSERFSKIIAEHANADVTGIEIIPEDDELKEDEYEVEMKSDSMDSNLALSEMLERPASRHRVGVPSHASDATKSGSDVELESQLQSEVQPKRYEDVSLPTGPNWEDLSVSEVPVVQKTAE